MLIKFYSLIRPFKSSPDTEDVMNCIGAWDTRLFKVLRVYPLLNIRSDKGDYLWSLSLSKKCKISSLVSVSEKGKNLFSLIQSDVWCASLT